MSAIPKVCTVCGRRALPGSTRCALHQRPPAPRIPEAERAKREPYRAGYRDPAYRKARALRFERAGGRCELCRQPLQPGHWHAHHVLPLRMGGNNAVANLRVLCERCHNLVTLQDRRAQLR
jgi:5-methylcytosine-specific restriction endonuclease McrA